MDFKKLAAKAKETIDKRGGMDSLKADAEELKRVAKASAGLAIRGRPWVAPDLLSNQVVN